jgi:hypothetical protein
VLERTEAKSPYFDEPFQDRLRKGKYTRWAVNLDQGTLHAMLWHLEEFACRVGRIRPAAGASEVGSLGMDERRVAGSLNVLAAIGRGARMDLDGSRLLWDEFRRKELPPGLGTMVRRIEPGSADGALHWTGAIGGARPCARLIPPSTDPLVVQIRWVDTDGGEAREVGCFRLDVESLLAADFGWVRDDGSIEIAIARDLDGCICIVSGAGRIPLGRPLESPAGEPPSGGHR